MKTIFSFEAIGTHWEIEIQDETRNFGELEKKVKDRIGIFDKNYSRFREDSLVFEMSRNVGTYTLPDDAKPMLDLYEKLYKITDGAFTPLIGDTLVSAGYDASYSLVTGEMKKTKSWEESLVYSFPNMTILKPTMLDFGGLGKGYLIDIVSEILKNEGIGSFTVDAGGDIYTFGNELIVGLEHPENNKQVIGTIKINNESICGSAGSRRAWGDFHHIINPHTLASPKHILGSWATAQSTLLADAMATCLFLTDSDTLKKNFDFEFLTVSESYRINKSENFKAEIFTE